MQKRTTTGSRRRTAIGFAVILTGMLLSLVGLTADPAAAFEGGCTPTPGDPSSGTCVLDETNGGDPSTWGTMTYSRVGDVMTFTFDADFPITSLLACFNVTAPYPTSGQPCTGADDPQYNGAAVDPLVIDLANPPGADIPGFDPGDPVFFAVHVNQKGATTYGIGGAGAPVVPPAATYECTAATNVTQTSATLNGATTDAAATSATFTLNPGNIVLVDNTGPSPFSVNATGLTANTAYTYTVEFDPGDHAQSNAACGFTTPAAPPVPTYECSAATGVTQTTATLNGATTDAAATSAVFTLSPGGIVLNDNDGAPFTVNASGLAPSTAYTYTVEFDPGDHAQSNAACGFTTLAAAGGPGPVVVPGPVVPPVTPPVVDECPAMPGLQTNPDQCLQVLPEVIEPETPPVVPTPTPPAAPTEVQGEVVARELPRTGTTTLPLLQVGLGLILLGAGAMLFGRERTALI